ncbi:MAG: hypothetical protein HUJ22_07365 [Gracilimonas sp.]|uniref:type IX secretion system periplasmic lipoprotein PorW/SprE n=1 Tax=Gracilimonas sp. TaxID=1974203 RepID=UPI0019C41CDB|nr:hypothetical protein [Gracilimonas sp.]MBD3616376.1 hypothetical protein [Gracilimonas sp.]
MRKVILWISVLILTTGCKTTLSSNWKNFNAYYNTFYNAEKSFEAGLKKNMAQNRDYNPLQPIRIHPSPVNAGAQDFDKAIQKAADILRRHRDTKWVDDAIFLIGKSYYYRQDFFSADQKFKELYINSEDPLMRQKSILWQARVLLDMKLHNEGIAFLSEQLTAFEDEWDEKQQAEAKALLAQHHVEMENWQQAAFHLSEALPHLPHKDYRARGYFLLGQVYEEMGVLHAAYEAFTSVSDHFVDYSVHYLAQRKRAEVARKLGRNDLAFSILNIMTRDDKNLEFKAELDFELARTEHERGNYPQAEKQYNDVLRRDTNQLSEEIAARAYNGLAEIYRYEYDDFARAAAYYDSAAQKNVSAERLPDGFQAQQLAESFGNYARIKSDMALQDSLLRLGQLSQDQLDSVLVELRIKKIRELEAAREQEQQKRLITRVNRTGGSEEMMTSNGFLNANNRLMQENMRQQFYAMWGNRPLADNWRVRSMIQAATYTDEVEEADLFTNETVLSNIEIDLSRVPFAPEEQDSVRKRISMLNYELGNLFFLSLNMPDSAAYYFQKAIAGPSDRNISMVSLYSLSELYTGQENEEKAKDYAIQLIDECPNSQYARRVADQFDIPLDHEADLQEVDLVQLYRHILQQDSLDTQSKANRLKNFSYSYSTHEIAPMAQFEAIQAYMEAGKKDSLYESRIEAWVNLNQSWEKTYAHFEAQKDSARALLQDASLSEERRLKYRSLIDSTLQQPDFSMVFPYKGTSWDSARAVADTFLVMFPNSDLAPKVERLTKELEAPKGMEGSIDQFETINDETSSDYLNCNDIGKELSIRGGVQRFMENWEKVDAADIQEVTYHFKVNRRGIVEEYSLQTENLSEEFKAAFEQYISQSLSFEPVLYQGQAVSLECDFTFPITN